MDGRHWEFWDNCEYGVLDFWVVGLTMTLATLGGMCLPSDQLHLAMILTHNIRNCFMDGANLHVRNVSLFTWCLETTKRSARSSTVACNESRRPRYLSMSVQCSWLGTHGGTYSESPLALCYVASSLLMPAYNYVPLVTLSRVELWSVYNIIPTLLDTWDRPMTLHVMRFFPRITTYQVALVDFSRSIYT